MYCKVGCGKNIAAKDLSEVKSRVAEKSASRILNQIGSFGGLSFVCISIVYCKQNFE